MDELKKRLDELENQHNDLRSSYESLQLEHSKTKQALDRLLNDSRRQEEPPEDLHESQDTESGICGTLLCDYSLYDFGFEDANNHE